MHDGERVFIPRISPKQVSHNAGHVKYLQDECLQVLEVA